MIKKAKLAVRGQLQFNTYTEKLPQAGLQLLPLQLGPVVMWITASRTNRESFLPSPTTGPSGDDVPLFHCGMGCDNPAMKQKLVERARLAVLAHGGGLDGVPD